MNTEENKHSQKSEDEAELELFDGLSDRHIQIKIMKATERTSKNVAFFFWVSILSAAYWLCVFLNA